MQIRLKVLYHKYGQLIESHIVRVSLRTRSMRIKPAALTPDDRHSIAERVVRAVLVVPTARTVGVVDAVV